MLNIRKSLFETNSSSVHALVIPKDQSISIPKKVILHYGEYGWEADSYDDTLDYVYTACVDQGQKEVDKLISYLKYKGVEEIELRNSEYNYGIDHGYEVPLDDLFTNENLLDRFIFGNKSFVQTGNDNNDYYPKEEDYDKNEYDVLMKYN